MLDPVITFVSKIMEPFRRVEYRLSPHMSVSLSLCLIHDYESLLTHTSPIHHSLAVRTETERGHKDSIVLLPTLSIHDHKLLLAHLSHISNPLAISAEDGNVYPIILSLLFDPPPVWWTGS